ncbi:uncharacterized protein G2W53_024210 [Senna tora]|uniref:Uncharacterized protein n=1 Tax=Senna tora TaxID=362788 RepID=A0A834TCX7_9FABA|nr:uncharacterized protein G2W53_024210 [Senna tora]
MALGGTPPPQEWPPLKEIPNTLDPYH